MNFYRFSLYGGKNGKFKTNCYGEYEGFGRKS